MEGIKKLANIIEDKDCGIEIYAILIQENARKLKQMPVNEKGINLICKLMKDSVRINILNDEIEKKHASELNSNLNCLYSLDLDEYNPFEFSENILEEKLKSDDKIDGFMIKMGTAKDNFFIYQNLYQSAIIKNRNKVALVMEEDYYKNSQSNILVIEKRIDCIIMEKELIIKNHRILETKFNFELFIRNTSKKVSDMIIGMNLVNDMEKILKYSEGSELRFARKLMRAKDSPIFNFSKQEIISNVSETDTYNKLIQNNEFVINTKQKVEIFLKLINDQILKSLITGIEYDASIKKNVDEVESIK